MARSRDKDVVAVAMVTMEARSIHRLDTCGLVCDMLRLIRYTQRGRKALGLALHLNRGRWLR